jgi:hypothetical protein
VLTQAEMAEKWQASVMTVNRMPIDVEKRLAAGLSPCAATSANLWVVVGPAPSSAAWKAPA